MRIYKNPKIITTVLLIISMIFLLFASTEYYIPAASIEIINDAEIEESESIEITNSSYTPVSMATLLNDSVLNSENYWNKINDSYYNYSRFTRLITTPFINVSGITLEMTAYVVSGPLNISLEYNSWKNRAFVIGETSEYCKIVQYLSPEDYVDHSNGPCLMSVTIQFEGVNWSVIDQLYFSLQVQFTDTQVPVTIDLQRTNGESMYLLPEFRRIWSDDLWPRFVFNELVFFLCQANDTIFLPIGNYSLLFGWWGYNLLFDNISITDRSLRFAIRIRSIRLDVVSLQKIPGYYIEIGAYPYPRYGEYLIADSPSLYLPPEYSDEIILRNYGYAFYLRSDVNIHGGQNQNITMLVNENWIMFGNIAITPGRLAILGSSLLVLGLTILLSRKKLTSSTIYVPFIFMFLGYILPLYVRKYSETYYFVSVMFATSISSTNSTATAISGTSTFALDTSSLILISLLLLVFLGVTFEIFREETKVEFTDLLIAVSIFLCLCIVCIYMIRALNSYYATTIGPSPFMLGLAFILWIVLYKRQGKPFFETITS